ncbi:MAG: VCBS repeat-containing protein [Deltaproteobacteria bacterium]|nr:VCBS repeat-containing protein [Deltaproteobacteria bacterium]
MVARSAATRGLVALAATAIGFAARPARADDFLHRLVADARARVDAEAAAHAPRPVPPVPVAVKWRPAKLTSIDLGAPLVALTAADLDGDGKAELYAVTTHDVIAIGWRGKRLDELARVPFAGDVAVPVPRDPVGTAVADGRALVASTSGFARALRVTWQGKQLVGAPGEADFELCPGEHAKLVPGRDVLEGNRYAVVCRDLVDATGAPLHVRGELAATGRLAVDAGTAHFEVPEVGVAFELADLDHDGTPEVIYAGAGAPGDPDSVKVVSLGGDPRKPRWKKPFTAGGVAGIAVGDLDGDKAPEVIAAVRLVGATRVDLWRLE